VDAKGQDEANPRTNESKVSPNFRVVSRPQDAVPETPKVAPKFRVVSQERVPRNPPKHQIASSSFHGNEECKKTIHAFCPHCFREYEVEASALGMYADCPSCGQHVRVQAAQLAGNGLDGTGGCPRLSIAIPLVFQCILLGLSAIANYVFFAGAFDGIDTIASLFLLLVIPETVFSAILHFNCWMALPEGFSRMTPGRAVGPLFIPFYGLYWLFPSIYGLGGDCAMFAENRGINGFKHLRALGLTLAILACAIRIFRILGVMWLGGAIPESIANGYFDGGDVFYILFTASLGGIPMFGLFLSIAAFIIWLLFYRGVAQLLNRFGETGEDTSFGENRR
jgi:hypothetical protein